MIRLICTNIHTHTQVGTGFNSGLNNEYIYLRSFWHWSQEYVSLLCTVYWWSCKFLVVLKEAVYSDSLHFISFSMWTSWCLTRLLLAPNSFPQVSQKNLFGWFTILMSCQIGFLGETLSTLLTDKGTHHQKRGDQLLKIIPQCYLTKS